MPRHYTTAPRQHEGWRNEQIEAHKAGKPPPPRPSITDDEIRESIANGQLKVQRERGTDLTIFSPRAAGMGHHLGDATTSEAWASAYNELIYCVCSLFPRNFIGVAMLGLGGTPGRASAYTRRHYEITKLCDATRWLARAAEASMVFLLMKSSIARS